MYQTPYIPDEDRIIREMAAAGATPQDVSKVLLSRTPEAIRGHAKHIGVTFQRKPEIDFDAFKSIMKRLKTPVTA